MSNKVIVIHGGSGTILKENMPPEKEDDYRELLTKTLKAGFSVLHEGGTALDAVETAVRVLEDDPLFNAGKGCVFTHEFSSKKWHHLVKQESSPPLFRGGLDGTLSSP